MTVNTNHVKPDLEPRFVLRAQDKFALPTLAAYRELCVQHDLMEQAVQVTRAYVEINRWQQANPERVKLPDHDHVPVQHSV